MNKAFWRATAIRAIKTVCQTAVAMIGTAAVMTDVNWLMVASASALSGILSVLTSIAAGLPEVDYVAQDNGFAEDDEDDDFEDDFEDDFDDDFEEITDSELNKDEEIVEEDKENE